MSLPGVNITLENGALGGIPASNDGIAGMVLTGVNVPGSSNVQTGDAYQFSSLKDAEAKGILTSNGNAYAHSQIKAFYSVAPKGSQLWIMLVAGTVPMQEMLDKDQVHAKRLVDASNGEIRILGVSSKYTSGGTITNGLSEEVDQAMIKGQQFATLYSSMIKPFRFVVDGKSMDAEIPTLKNYSTANFNRGSIFISSDEDSRNAKIGLYLGQLSANPVQRKVSRVKNGPLPISEVYMTNLMKCSFLEDAWDALHDKGYVFLRSFVGKSGWYFSSDRTATSLTDDYSSMARGRVIDKAIRIAYDVYVDEIDDEIEVDDQGRIDAGIVKSLQEQIVTRLELQMRGEIAGAKCIIDPLQNVLSTNKLDVVLRIRPFGYKSFIDISLGLENPALNN